MPPPLQVAERAVDKKAKVEGEDGEEAHPRWTSPPCIKTDETTFEYPLVLEATLSLSFGAPARICKVLPLLFGVELPTATRARAAVKAGDVLLNGVLAVTSRLIGKGDVAQLRVHRKALFDPNAQPSERVLKLKRQLQAAGLRVLRETSQWAVIFKPAGYHVKGTADDNRCVEGALRCFLSYPFPPPPAAAAPTHAITAIASETGAKATRKGPSEDSTVGVPAGAMTVLLSTLLPRPLAIHRLDCRVCGLVLVAKTRRALAELSRLFQKRAVRKRYRALLVGRLEGEGTVEVPVAGRPSMSRWRGVRVDRCARNGWISTVDLFPVTGRTHQLRIHMASLGHPIVGDDLYHEMGREAARASHAHAAGKQQTSSKASEPLGRPGTRAEPVSFPACRKGRGLFLQACEISCQLPPQLWGRGQGEGDGWDNGRVTVQIDEVNKFELFRAKALKGVKFDRERGLLEDDEKGQERDT